MQQLFAAAAQMQSQLMSAQQQLAETEVEGSAGGGLVTVTVNGQGELVDVAISKDAIDPGDAEESRRRSPTWCWPPVATPTKRSATCSPR